MTHATKAIYKLLLTDYIKVSKVSVEDMLYDEQDIIRSMDKVEVCFTFYFLICLFIQITTASIVNFLFYLFIYFYLKEHFIHQECTLSLRHLYMLINPKMRLYR